MADIQGLVYESRFGLVVCKIHGTAIHPEAKSLQRHLRGQNHHCKGPVLKRAVDAILQLPLKSKEELRDACPAICEQPVQKVANLAVLQGWNCQMCRGHFLTTSQELCERHMSKTHGQRSRSRSTQWEKCLLQTFFSMTSDRQYFRIAEEPRCEEGIQDTPNDEPDLQAALDDPSTQEFLLQSQERRKRHEQITADTSNRVPDPNHGQGTELWMAKLGIDQYVAGLHKDEMAKSYKDEGGEEHTGLSDLQITSTRILRETWQTCQVGASQRMTDPQAARISSFWHQADPEGKAKTFRRVVQKDTLTKYINHWSQMLTFCWNGWREELFRKSIVALSQGDGDQAELIDRFLYLSPPVRCGLQAVATASNSSSNTDEKVELLTTAVTELSQALIEQHLAKSPFRSPILAYAAMLSVDGKSGSWEEPGSFNSYLSALVYCGQLWIFRFACNAADVRHLTDVVEDDFDDGLDEELDRYMQSYFTNTVSKPLAYVLLWRRRLFGIAPLTMVNRPAWWNLQRSAITYQGITVTMDQVRHLCRFTIDRARSLLFDDLMFGATHIPKIMPQHLQENDSVREKGWWFAHHPENAVHLSRHNDVLIEHVLATPELREIYLQDSAVSECECPRISWRPNSIRLYEELAQSFLKDMAVAIHFSAGPPVRAPEFTTPMWRNSEQLRHIQLRHGQVMIHLVEHKMMATTGKNVNNIRFLCDELSELLVNYLVYVVPVLEAMTWQDSIEHSVSPFLWSDSEGKRWSPDGFGNMLKAACRRAGVPAIGTSVWRQMSSSVINTHFDEDDHVALLAAQDREESEEVDEDGKDRTAATLVSMSNHSLRTHRNAYANVSPFANVWDGKLVKSYQASRAWARFFGLGVEEATMNEPDKERKRRGSSIGGKGVASKVLRIGVHYPRRYWSDGALLHEARKLYQSERVQWRCPEQQQAMRLVANNSPEVLLVMATGAGKSMMFILGSSLPGARTTVVIVPLVLLRLDLIRRCEEMKLRPIVWANHRDTPGIDGQPTLLFVSVEVAARHTFRQYAQKLYDSGNLHRFVLDECHLIHTSAHYRKFMTQLNELRQYTVPFVYMTATLPPRLERVLFQKHHIGSRVSIVRGCTKRPNLHYSVWYLQPGKDESFLEHACTEIQQRWELLSKSDWIEPRAIVFVRSRTDAEEAAKRLQATFYHREIGSVEEKEARLRAWISGESGSPFLVGTTAAGSGVDYAHVRWVIHLEDPYGLVDYAQESGRAGRDGDAAGASIFMRRDPCKPPPPTPLDHYDPADDLAMKMYLEGKECRRLCMARELDHEDEWVECQEGDILCDVCDGKGAATKTAEMMRTESRKEEHLGGLIRHRHEQMSDQQEMDEYRWRVSQVRDGCMICKVLGCRREWRHRINRCGQQQTQEYFRCKKQATQRCPRWMADFAACFKCGQPQWLCLGWGDRNEGSDRECKYADLAIPVVWAMWMAGGEERMRVERAVEVKIASAEEAILAAGRGSRLGGERCIVGVQILAEQLGRWQGTE